MGNGNTMTGGSLAKTLKAVPHGGALTLAIVAQYIFRRPHYCRRPEA